MYICDFNILTYRKIEEKICLLQSNIIYKLNHRYKWVLEFFHGYAGNYLDKICTCFIIILSFTITIFNSYF